MTKQDDGLFLLEVLVDKIVFVKSPCFSDKDFRTCVNIEAPSVEPLEICDDDPGACIATSGGPFVKTFNNGKSCLFSLKQSDISAAMSKFPIKISVYKSLPCGCLPTKIMMGTATIDMTKEFVQARKKFLEDPNTVSYQALKDSFRIIGPDGEENGEILMFLRISCFGKLIITRFQGASGPPKLGAGGGSAIVDRSCNPRREYQLAKDPCACGTGRAAGAGSTAVCSPPCLGFGGGGGAPCPLVPDPYDSMPCENPEDPCYCSGPKPARQPPMICRNTDQYCLHVPKGALPSLPFYQDLNEVQIMDIKSSWQEVTQDIEICSRNNFLSHKDSQANLLVSQCLKILIDNLKLPNKKRKTDFVQTNSYSASSLSTFHSKRRSVSFSESVNYIAKPLSSYSSIKSDGSGRSSAFSKQETTVYMTLFDNVYSLHTSGTQATASINKCVQVTRDRDFKIKYLQSTLSGFGTKSDMFSSTTMSTQSYKGTLRNSDVYFFGRKKDIPKSGMGNSDSDTNQTKHQQVSQKKQSVNTGSDTNFRPTTQKSSFQGSTSIQANCTSSCAWVQTKAAQGSTTGTCTTKVVSIKEETDKPPCPAVGSVKAGDLAATVSHIQIGPAQTCPYHPGDPCTGPKCILASSTEDDKVPVKVTTVSNPRRGVFELVVRRLNGAPLARNELMLEWTPPPSRAPCGSPYSVPCSYIGSCRPSKCKMFVCRPSTCKPKYCKKSCRKSCSPRPCRSPCRLPCGSPCQSPCSPPSCRSPCFPSSCRVPCYTVSCASPCRIPCFPPSCRSPCQPPTCRSPCTRPCRSPCPSPCQPSPCRPPKCRSPCSRPCRPSPCRPSPCRSPPCRPPPCRPPSCRPPSCRLPCLPPPCQPPAYQPPACQPSPCQPPPCQLPPCQPSPCRSPCRPLPCRSPCRRRSSCRSPCRPSPCRSPCRKPCYTICRVARKRRISPFRPACQPPPCVGPCRLLCNTPCAKSCKPNKPCSPCSPCPKSSTCKPNKACPPCKKPCSPTYCVSPCILSRKCSSPCSPCRAPCSAPCDAPCGAPCGSPCDTICGPPCGSPCGVSCDAPCGAPCGAPCDTVCGVPCDASPCGSYPCSVVCSSPCLLPCRKKPRCRRSRSQPRIKPHKKLISPCYNRPQVCPAVRCKSVPGPCISCCAILQPCSPPPKCCSVFPYKPIFCKSACSTCCE